MKFLLLLFLSISSIPLYGMETVVAGQDAIVSVDKKRPLSLAVACRSYLTAERFAELLDKDQAYTQWLEEEAYKHPAPVTAVAFQKEGQLLVVGCSDGSLHMWDTETDKKRIVFKQEGGIKLIEFHEKDKDFLSLSDNGKLMLYHVHDQGVEQMSITHKDGTVSACAFVPQANLVALAGNLSDYVELYTLKGKRKKVLSCEGPVICMSFNANGTLMATVNSEQPHKVIITDTRANKGLNEIVLSPAAIDSVQFHKKDTDEFAVILRDKGTFSVCYWRLRSGQNPEKLGHTKVGKASSTLCALALHNRTCATYSPLQSTVTIDQKNDKHTFDTFKDINTLVLSKNGKVFAAGGADGMVTLCHRYKNRALAWLKEIICAYVESQKSPELKKTCIKELLAQKKSKTLMPWIAKRLNIKPEEIKLMCDTIPEAIQDDVQDWLCTLD